MLYLPIPCSFTDLTGPAGCALAHGLKKAGVSYSIFDKGEDVYRHRHWAFTLGWARPYLLGLLPDEIASQLDTCAVDPSINCAAIGEDRIVLYNGQTREEAFAFPIPRAKEMNIRKLRILLAESLDVQYGKRFSHYEMIKESSVRVWFEDGTSEEGDIVIGIDGAGSTVRQCLIDRKATQETLPFALMNFNASYTREQALFIKERLHPLVDIAIHPAGHYIRANVLDIPDVDDPTTWTFQILSTWPLKNAEDYDNETDRLKRLKAHVARDGWAEPYKSAIEWIPEDTPVLKDQLKIWKTQPWNNQSGRVTLCGDAAHAMTFRKSDAPITQFKLTGYYRSRSGSKQCVFLCIQSGRSLEICTRRNHNTIRRNNRLRRKHMEARRERGPNLKIPELLHTRLAQLHQQPCHDPRHETKPRSKE